MGENTVAHKSLKQFVIKLVRFKPPGIHMNRITYTSKRQKEDMFFFSIRHVISFIRAPVGVNIYKFACDFSFFLVMKFSRKTLNTT